MKVGIIGTGYVGLVTGTCFAEMGHNVTCLDIDQIKINLLRQGHSPLYEPGLGELLERNIKSNRLNFTNNYQDLKNQQIIFLAVGTPSRENGEADLTYLFNALESLVPELHDNIVIVIKSTVPIGTHLEVINFIKCKSAINFHLVNNPEFLKEGSAIDDFMRPDRVVIGHSDQKAFSLMEELYRPLVRQGNPIIQMSNISAEMTKYAANSLLACKISFINEMARICDALGADIEEVRRGITTDKRIGPHFLYPGPGYGGSCFPKDVSALIQTAQKLNVPTPLIKSVEVVNERQKHRPFEKIISVFDEKNLKDKTISIWGVAFKPNTDDVRHSAASVLVEDLLKQGAKINYYDPIASENFERYCLKPLDKIFPNLNVSEYVQRKLDKYECLNQSDALVVITDWAEFKVPDFEKIKSLLRSPVIVDCRNLFQTEEVQSHGFKYLAIGKKIIT
jgi:UDPglucose 6-dehydrogenase